MIKKIKFLSKDWLAKDKKQEVIASATIEYCPQDIKSRRGILMVDKEFIEDSEFWYFLLSFCVVYKCEYDIGWGHYELHILSKYLPMIPEERTTPHYELIIEEK